MVDLSVDLGYSKERMQNLLESVFRLTPKPDLVFLVDLPEEIAYKRNLAKQDGLSLDYLRERRKFYLNMATRLETVLLDGTKERKDLESVVLSKVKEVVEENG